jgi:YrbI family 3-deoxy-D-manno-octulosonate 8-phosphate phosphatase
MRSVAIIPARGGSRGLPRKNVALLDGKPLVVHSINAAREANEVDIVVVSTDDPEIAQIAEAAGAWVIERPTEIAGDTASSESAVLHALQVLAAEHGIWPDLTVFLQCTSPLTTAFDIDETIGALRDQGADTALSVTPCHQFLWRQTDDGSAEGLNHQSSVRQRRQDREPQFVETGAVYVMRTAGFQLAKHRFFGQIAMHIMPRERVWEIDDPSDFTVARALLEARRFRDAREVLPFQAAALVLDFDGVFTDNMVIVFQDGTEGVRCSRSDGAGLAQLKRAGVPLLVLSAEVNPVVAARCRKLDIPCLQGISDKRPVLLDWLAEHHVDPAHTIYIGNDLPDIPCMQAVGCGVAVADAHPRALDAADLILQTAGGHGAIRELVDLMIDTANAQKEASR